MESEFINELIRTHGMSGAVAFSIGYFIIRKLPILIEKHLDNLNAHFEKMAESLDSVNTRADERHRELLNLIQKKKGEP